jgi:AcrR family transcriptional regulator
MNKSHGQLAGADERDGDTEQRILEAARQVFLHRGTAGARMKEIAEVAGVNQALLHYYFRSKERLADAVFQQAGRQLLPQVLAVLGSDATIEKKVEQVVQIELDHLSRTPYLPGYLLSELHQNPDRVHQLVASMAGMDALGVVPKVLATLKQQIDVRVRAGTMRPIAPEQLVINLLSLCIFPFAAKPMLSAVLKLDQKGFERFIARRKTELAAFVLNALRP